MLCCWEDRWRGQQKDLYKVFHLWMEWECKTCFQACGLECLMYFSLRFVLQENMARKKTLVLTCLHETGFLIITNVVLDTLPKSFLFCPYHFCVMIIICSHRLICQGLELPVPKSSSQTEFWYAQALVLDGTFYVLK